VAEDKDTIGVTELIKGKPKYVPKELCFHSPFNTRKTRDAKQIKRLAERIKRFGSGLAAPTGRGQPRPPSVKNWGYPKIPLAGG